VLPLQAEVAHEIVRRIKGKVLPRGEVGSGISGPMSSEAYEAYLKGYYFQMKRTRSDTVRALRYFQEVIRLEPDHPLGYSGLADEYSCAPTHSWSISNSELWPSVPSEMIARARENAEKAVDLDPLSGAAHTSLALISTFGDWNFPAAEVEFRRALELSPGNAWSHYGYSYLLAVLHRFDEARLHLEEARALDPLRVDYTMALAELYLWTGDPERAFSTWKQAEEIDPTYPGLHQAVITGFCNTQRHDEAIAALLGANRKYPDDPLVLAEVAYCRALVGESEQARELLKQIGALSDSMYVSPVARGMVHMALGELDLALTALEQGVRERDFWAVYLGVDPTWDPLRENPRFIELLERVGLPRA
jgi:tetratricopeptide (TPR) repeat protein